jgi:hypothetical protein
MRKNIRLRVALIISAVALFRVAVHLHRIVTGCMELGNHLRCSFENERNFQGLLDLDLFVTCGWVAGAVICWMSFAQAGKKRS